jgi:hypothetical protein
VGGEGREGQGWQLSGDTTEDAGMNEGATTSTSPQTEAKRLSHGPRVSSSVLGAIFISEYWRRSGADVVCIKHGPNNTTSFRPTVSGPHRTLAAWCASPSSSSAHSPFPHVRLVEKEKVLSVGIWKGRSEQALSGQSLRLSSYC